MNCDEIKELLEAYAVGTLDDQTRAAVEQHLAGCPDCRALADEYREIVALLPQALASAAPKNPPDALKTRLLQNIQAKPRAQARTRVPKIFWQRLNRYSSLAAAILLVICLSYIVRLNAVLAQEQGLRERLTHQTELIFEVVDSEKTRRHFLAPTQNAPRINNLPPPYGKIFTRSDLPYVVAMTGRLPPPPAGKSYHLWLFNRGQAELAGAMTVDEAGFGSFVYDAGQNGPTFSAAQLILQDSGATSPTEHSVLIWEMQNGS